MKQGRDQKKLIGILGICLMILISGALPGKGFSSGLSYGYSGEEDSLLTVGIESSTGNFNPFYYPQGADGDVVDLVFQRLVRRDFEGNWTGDAAEEWEISEDGKIITVTLREGLTFSDGEAVTAEDVVFSYRVISDPSYAGGHNTYARKLEGYQSYREGDTEDFPGVRAIDDGTVEFRFQQGGGENLESVGFYIVPKHEYQEFYRYNDTARLREKRSEPLGSGPYTLENLIMGEYVYLTGNPHYYNEETYAIEEIIMQLIEENTEIDDLTQGNVDLINGQSEIRNIKIAKGEDGIAHNKYYNDSQGLYFFNHENGATQDPAVRKALRHAMDLEELMEHHFEGYGTVPAHFFGENADIADEEGIQSLKNPSYDLEKAKEILAEGGWHLNDDGYREKDGEVLTLRIIGSTHSDIIETLSPLWDRDWANALGIEIDNAYGGMNAIMEDLIYDADANVDVWNVVFLELSLDPFAPLGAVEGYFHSSNIGTNRGNISRYQNEALDEVIEKARETEDLEEEKAYYVEIAEILQEEDAYAPVYTPEYYDLYTEKLTDFKTNSHFTWTRALETARLSGEDINRDGNGGEEEEGVPWRTASYGVIALFLLFKWKNRR